MSKTQNNIFKTGYVLNEKWIIIEFIDKGAMGEVYRAHQLNLKRDVAIKVISQEMLESFEEDPAEIETALHRFRREVQAMAQVRHPNVLQIFDYGSDVIEKNGKDIMVEYIVMEYIPGATLRFTMSEEGFFPEQNLIAIWLVDYFLPLLEGVEAIHAKDIIHRDLKPENVLLDDVTPKIADFGLACSMRMQHVTQSVDIRGTPAYMSPEHFFDLKKADRQSDIYSLGKILFEVIDGQITSKILPFKQAALANPDTPFFQKLNQIIQATTAEEKDKRLKSIGDLRNALLEALDILKRPAEPEDSVTPKPFAFLHQPGFIWAGIVIAILSVALMGLWHLMGEPGKTTAPLKSPQTAQIESHQPTSSDLPKAEPTSAPSPPQSILGQDGMPMLFIPGGEVKVGMEGLNTEAQKVQVLPFYLDRDLVTNHHFADFLNEVKGTLVVENGVVKSNNEIWFYIGKGTEPQEQIIYEHERFHLRDTAYAAHPVVRVTWYGALAYARHYDKRLVFESEWDYLSSKKRFRSIIVSTDKTYSHSMVTPEESDSPETHVHMMQMDAASDGKETGVKSPLGSKERDDTSVRIAVNNISVPKGIKKDYKEWVTREYKIHGNQKTEATKEDITYQSLVVEKSFGSGPELKTFRYPWEAFSDVGFRCALNLGKNTEENR